MSPLSIEEVERLRALVLENASELLAEARLLFEHQKYARAYALAHFSSEELAKLPMLAGVGIDLLKGHSIDWNKFEKKLGSHAAKLKVLLAIDFLGTAVDPTSREIPVHKQKLSRIELFNALKNAALYAGVYQGGAYKPSAFLGQAFSENALTLSANRFELFAQVEANTQGRLSQLSNSDAYMKLLKKLQTGDSQ